MHDITSSKTRVSYITSEPIHPLGINVGERVTLDYDWEDYEEMFKDFSRRMTRIILANEITGEETVVIFDNWIPKLEDVLAIEELEND